MPEGNPDHTILGTCPSVAIPRHLARSDLFPCNVPIRIGVHGGLGDDGVEIVGKTSPIAPKPILVHVRPAVEPVAIPEPCPLDLTDRRSLLVLWPNVVLEENAAPDESEAARSKWLPLLDSNQGHTD